jgi:acetate kinase
MGLTPTGGVIMGTRTGDLDPGVFLYILREEKLSVDELTRLFNNQSGMFAYSDGESDMQALSKRAQSGDAAAELAIDAFCHSVRKFIGAYAALLGGIDLLVFSGGIGENSADVRRRICAPLAFLGIELDAPNGKVRIVPTEEERQMSRITRGLLAAR